MTMTDWESVSRRLRIVREATGHTQTSMCALLKIPINRWNNVERGGVPLSRDLAILLCRRVPGLTLDYLYFGKTEGLTVKLARDLEAAGPKA